VKTEALINMARYFWVVLIQFIPKHVTSMNHWQGYDVLFPIKVFVIPTTI